MSITLPAPVQGYLAASNAFDGDALIAWFADDALVNDTRREFWGKDAIRAWLDREIIGDKVTTSPTATAEHYGEVIVHAVTDGEYDKTGLPDPLVLTYYFTVRDDRRPQHARRLPRSGPVRGCRHHHARRHAAGHRPGRRAFRRPGHPGPHRRRLARERR